MTAPAPGIPVCETDFYSDEVIADPHPFYARLREMGPVVWLAANGLYALPRHDECSRVLRQPLRFSSARGVSPIARVNEILVGSTLNSDPPRHDVTRAVTSEPLLPGALGAVEPRIAAAAEGLVEALVARGRFDAVADLARVLPVTIVAELVGLPQAAGADQMLRWASATFNLFGTENARTTAAFADLADLRDFLQEHGRPERLAPGGWARRIFEVGPERGLTYDECAQLMRDYINPSLDTTISATGQIVKLFADNPDQWDLVREDAALVPGAVEEAVRLATPIRAFTRHVAEDSVIAGHPVPEGARVLVVYASANRDPRKFPDPDAFDVRRGAHDHLGFGQGVHMCMGMHLARREMILLVEALRRRVGRIELDGPPVVALNNTIRAYARLPVRVQAARIGPERAPARPAGPAPWLDLVVAARDEAATGIAQIDLRRPDGGLLPPAGPGDHVDVEVRSGLVRQYSLAGDPADRTRWRLGVRLDPASRGGSSGIHAAFVPGARVRVGRPRAGFPLVRDAAHSVLLAGGIGLTPLLSMAHALEARGASWELHVSARSAEAVPFRDALGRLGDKARAHVTGGERARRIDLGAAIGAHGPGRHLYLCGPAGFMEAARAAAARLGWDEAHVHLERFGAEIDTDGAPFTVVAARSGASVTVAPGQTIAERLAAHGIDVPVSCRSGVCGTCLTPVLEGRADHRDMVQTEAEKASGARVAVCCSRSMTARLVLDV